MKLGAWWADPLVRGRCPDRSFPGKKQRDQGIARGPGGPPPFLLFFLVASITGAQSMVDHGADVFAKTCATGYCHGSKGEGGGAPKLAGRGFDEAYIISVTRAGVAGTAMQGYGTILARPDFNAVIAYVAKLNGIEPRAGDSGPRELSAEASRGRELFSDALRGFARCSTCHLVDGFGTPAVPIHQLPADLRHASTTHVRNAAIDGDRFPALVVSLGGRRASLYDLSVVPPVLRTVDASALKISDAPSWRHPIDSYNDAELRAIMAFLKAEVR